MPGPSNVWPFTFTRKGYCPAFGKITFSSGMMSWLRGGGLSGRGWCTSVSPSTVSETLPCLVLQVGLEAVAAVVLPVPLQHEHEDQMVLLGRKSGGGEVVVDAVDVELAVGRRVARPRRWRQSADAWMVLSLVGLGSRINRDAGVPSLRRRASGC